MASKDEGTAYLQLRRRLLLGLAAAPFIAATRSSSVFAADTVNTTGLAVTDTEVTVGILHSVTGTMAISETGATQAEKLAFEQINASGGILGRKIKVIQEGRRFRLADLRRKGQEAPRQRPLRGDLRLLHLGFAQGGAAGDRAV